MNSRPELLMAGAPPQVTVQVQGQEVLSEKTEPSDFQPLPQVTPRAPEPGLEMPHGTTQESSLGLRVKEEPGVTEDPGEGRQRAHALVVPTSRPASGRHYPSHAKPDCHHCGSFHVLNWHGAGYWGFLVWEACGVLSLRRSTGGH